MTPQMISACEAAAQDAVRALPGWKLLFPGQSVPANTHTYIRVHVVASEDTFPIGIGRSAKKRNVGLLQFTVVTRGNRGAGEGGDAANVLWRAFTRRDIEVGSEGWITLKEGSQRDMGERGEEYIHIVRVPYNYDFA